MKVHRDNLYKKLETYGVDSKPTTVKNLQSNGLHERIHLVLCRMLGTEKIFVPKHFTAEKEIDRILQSAAWAMRTNSNWITKYSPK